MADVLMLAAIAAAAVTAIWLLWRPRPRMAVIIITDPYAAEVADFRRDVANWRG